MTRLDQNLPQGWKPVVKDPAVDLLARTVYGEARGESVRGKEAVAAVVMNRVARAEERDGYWWGNSVGEVVLCPWQFSCWNRKDPNRRKILNIDPQDPNFQTCIRIARRAVSGALKDPTHGATHYHTLRAEPVWSAGRIPSVIIGNHKFYNDVE